MMNCPVLDPCCGSRKFYFQKDAPFVLYGDLRDESYVQCDGRILDVHPDVQLDVTALPFDNESFSLVVFDPPHLKHAGAKSYMAQAYGTLPKNDPLGFLSRGFQECWRVLKPEGTLIFKWSQRDVPIHIVLRAFGQQPLFGNRLPKSQTFWMVYFKQKEQEPNSEHPDEITARKFVERDPETLKSLGIFD